MKKNEQKLIPNKIRYSEKQCYLCSIHKNLMLRNSDYLKGTLTTIILSLLEQNGKMYGYEICQKTEEQSKGRIKLTEGAIYPALHKLERKGLIVSSKEKFNGRIRKYYAIPIERKEIVTKQIHSLHDFIQSLNYVLQGN